MTTSILKPALETFARQDAAGSRTLPFVVEATAGMRDLRAWALGCREYIHGLLTRHGAVLFRGFDLEHAIAFRDAMSAIVGDLLEDYVERSSPRSTVEPSVFTSTTYPSDRKIFLHNEQSYNLHFPRFLGFFCVQAAQSGGQTQLADSRRVYARLDPHVIDRLGKVGYLYVRNFHKHMGIPWQQVFRTESPAVVEAYCKARDIQFEWIGQPGTRLRTSQLRPVIAHHPASNSPAWFNHATFFHVSSLDPDLRRLVELRCGADALPNATYYGDGVPIEDEVMAHLREAYLAEEVVFDWAAGDFLLIDNMLVSHGRMPFTGARRVLVSMASLHSWHSAAAMPA